MRLFILPLLFLLIACKQEKALVDRNSGNQEKFVKAVLKPSRADSLFTNEDVSEYLKKIDSNFAHFTVANVEFLSAIADPRIDSIMKLKAKTLGITKSFYKADFDNNGYTDLLIFGGWGVWSTAFEGKHLRYHCYAILNFKDDLCKFYGLQRDFRGFDLAEIRYTGEKPFIIIHSSESINYKDPSINDVREIKLTGKLGVFTEYNSEPEDNHIQQIEFEAGACYGTCPVFKITINKDRTAEFFAQYFNFSKVWGEDSMGKNEGLFKAVITESEFNKIFNLLNYINFKNLKDEYSVSHTDAPTGTLKITYNNGKIKNISDYGMNGTYGLRGVYDVFGALRFNQDWVKTE